eukprot:1074966-Pleurochrysis_carterae.AAC.1
MIQTTQHRTNVQPGESEFKDKPGFMYILALETGLESEFDEQNWSSRETGQIRHFASAILCLLCTWRIWQFVESESCSGFLSKEQIGLQGNSR